MIAADSSSMVAYLAGDTGEDILKLQSALDRGELRLPGVVLTELLSGAPGTAADIGLAEIGVLPTGEDFWYRAGLIRRRILDRGLKAKTADALIAQSCIDNDVALITRDRDFRHFAKHCGLRLA
jgi:predicted nucleic acid-binding protein